MRSIERIGELLAAAAAGRGAILARQELRAFENTDISELKRNLQEVGRHRDPCRGERSAEIFGKDTPGDLGDAPAWIDAGSLYEDLILCQERLGGLDHVFCLDPWAAQLRSRAGETAASAKWILVSDLADRMAGKEREYWAQLEEWFKTLSFAEIIPRRDWDQALGHDSSSPNVRSEQRLFAQKPGAWRWYRLGSPSRSTSLFLLVRYSGSLSHLRVLLDSLARQEGARDEVHSILLKGEGGEDPGPYLRWFERANPGLAPGVIQISGEWKEQLGLQLAKARHATVAMVGDHTILPLGFARKVLENPGTAVQGVPMGLEASAHILTGNLDPHPNYEVLLRATSGEEKRRTECARIIPPEEWARGEEDAVPRLFEIVKQTPASSGQSPWLWLELADLP